MCSSTSAPLNPLVCATSTRGKSCRSRSLRIGDPESPRHRICAPPDRPRRAASTRKRRAKPPEVKRPSAARGARRPAGEPHPPQPGARHSLFRLPERSRPDPPGPLTGAPERALPRNSLECNQRRAGASSDDFPCSVVAIQIPRNTAAKPMRRLSVSGSATS